MLVANTIIIIIIISIVDTEVCSDLERKFS